MAWWTEGELRGLKEAGAAVGSALVASYVRAKADGHLPWWKRLLVRSAEGIVSGFLAIGLAGFMEWTDPRTTVGVAAALSLVGTGFISDALVKWLGQRAARG